MPDKWEQYAQPADKWEQYAQPAPTPTPKPPTTGEQIANFPKEHPYITAAATMLPGVGPAIGGLTDPTGEVGKGSLKKAAGDAYGLLEGAGPLGMGAHYLAEKTGLGDRLRKATEPRNPQQEVGGYGTTAAEMALPAPKAIGLLPNTARAGENFNKALAVAKDVPVDVNKFAQPVLRAKQLNSVAGDPMAPVLRKALSRIGPTTEPLTYGDTRMLASSAGRKAQQTAMGGKLTGEMGKRLGQASRGLDEAAAEAAERAGVGTEHNAAMSEYRNAKRLEKAGDIAKKVAVTGALGGGLYEGGKHFLRKALGQ